MDVMHDTYPASAKYILGKRGLSIGLSCRNGSVLPDEGTEKQLDVLLAGYEALVQDIGMRR